MRGGRDIYGWILCRAQAAINAAEGDTGGSANQNLAGATIFWLLLGGLVWLLALIGMLLPEEALVP